MLTADEIDVNMDYDSVAKIGSMLGSGGVIILDEDTCIVKATGRIMRFYAHESCGWCIPCREGTSWLKLLFDRFNAGGGCPTTLTRRWMFLTISSAKPFARSGMPRPCRPSVS